MKSILKYLNTFTANVKCTNCNVKTLTATKERTECLDNAREANENMYFYNAFVLQIKFIFQQ